MSEQSNRQSRLITVLREGIALVQMILFKELRDRIDHLRPELSQPNKSRLAGAVINEIFATPNPDPEFAAFRRHHQANIEQELLGLADNFPQLLPCLTDALRLQALCDNQEGLAVNDALMTADKLGLVLRDRDVPLPSVFMTSVRELGARYALIVPPTPITDDDDQTIIH